MLKIRLSKRKISSYQKYDIVLTEVLSKQSRGTVTVLGFYIPSQTLIKLNKLKLTKAINNGAQVTNTTRHLINKFLNNI